MSRTRRKYRVLDISLQEVFYGTYAEIAEWLKVEEIKVVMANHQYLPLKTWEGVFYVVRNDHEEKMVRRALDKQPEPESDLRYIQPPYH